MPGEHFVVPPHWEWYILGYFFFAGITGGSFALGAMLRLWGEARDAAASRLAFLVSWPTLLVCPILLTLDLGQPARFWHMLIDSRTAGPAFKAWSPMSIGAWTLLVFGIFSTVFFFAALADENSRGPAWLARLAFGGRAGRAFMAAGALIGLFLAAYTGVLLAVSNQPIWSDTVTLGGLFLASALSGSAATLLLFLRTRKDTVGTGPKLVEADRYFIILELVLIVLFLVTIGSAVSHVLSGGWLLLWLVVLLGTVVPLTLHVRVGRAVSVSPAVTPVLVLLGVLALRAVIIFGAQS